MLSLLLSLASAAEVVGEPPNFYVYDRGIRWTVYAHARQQADEERLEAMRRYRRVNALILASAVPIFYGAAIPAASMTWSGADAGPILAVVGVGLGGICAVTTVATVRTVRGHRYSRWYSFDEVLTHVGGMRAPPPVVSSFGAAGFEIELRGRPQRAGQFAQTVGDSEGLRRMRILTTLGTLGGSLLVLGTAEILVEEVGTSVRGNPTHPVNWAVGAGGVGVGLAVLGATWTWGQEPETWYTEEEARAWVEG